MTDRFYSDDETEMEERERAAAPSPVGTPAPILTMSLVAVVSLLVEKYGRGQKSGRADYSVVIPCNEFDTLRTALTETLMPDLSDLKPEARAELAEFEAHLRAHHAVAQLDCRFCLLRMTRSSNRPSRRTCRTPYRGGTCGCGCGCDENMGRPEDGTCDCSECRPGQVVGGPMCSECGHATHPPRECADCQCRWGLSS